MKKIETEFKIELSKEEFESAPQLLEQKRFSLIKNSELTDYFFNVIKFDEKGFDFTRIRVYDGIRYQRTDKKWVIKNGERMREEVERESTLEEFEQLITEDSTYLTNTKYRNDWSVTFNNQPGIVSFDKVVFPDETRYFVELEVDVGESETNTVRPVLKQWLLETFNLSDREEGIGMMKLVISKIQLK